MKKFAYVFVALIVLIEHSSAAATGAATEQQRQQQQQQSSVTLDLPFKINEDCHQPRETGRCFALFHRFAFNVEKRVCEEFIYGGCGGNKNNFETLAECENICRILADEELLITTTTVASTTNSNNTTAATQLEVGIAVSNEQQTQNVADDSAPTPASTATATSVSTNSP